MPFCGGRVDSDNGVKSDGLEPRIYNNKTYDSVMYEISNKGMALAEGVALMATPNMDTDGEGAYTLSSDFFINLQSTDENNVLFTGKLGEIANEFAGNNEYFLEQYAKAFNYLVTADLFDGPTMNACQDVFDLTLEGQTRQDVLAFASYESSASKISRAAIATVTAVLGWILMA